LLSWTSEPAGAPEAAPDEELLIPIRHEADLLAARQRGRALAATLRFSSSELTLIATAISEVARNILSYAGTGEILLQLAHRGSQRGIVVVAQDEGPGIADLALAMQDGYSTAGSLGLGLPGSKRLMDEFDIASEVGRGTTITMSKWEH
jgi:serine/threonine-protein kinase RsbT